MPAWAEAATPLVADVLRGPDALDAIRGEWDALWSRVPGATVFQSPAWLIPWWRHFGNGAPWIIAVRRGVRLAGVAPMYVHVDPTSGARQVTLIGNGVTDHLDVLLDADRAREAAAAVLAQLGRCRSEWERCDFRDLPADSPLLTAPLPAGTFEAVSDEVPCPVLALPENIDALLATMPAKRRGALRYARRRAERQGGVRFALADDATFDDAFDALVRLHRARWGGRAGDGVLADAAHVAFHRDAARALLARGWLRLYTMAVGDRTVAAHYGILARGRAAYYLGGFDPAAGDVSPGSLVVLHAITEAIREGAREFDFLRGLEAYKYDWGAIDRAQFRRQLRAIAPPAREGG